MTAVEVHHLSKNYPLNRSQVGRLRHLFGTERRAPRDGLWALRDVSFSVERGEAFGIIGPNGSGKSTLLRMVAGILTPTSGSVQVKGRMSALLVLGSGFSPEFTGRDNVYLNGSLLGLSREEIDVRYEAIERFAEIGDFIDQPIRTYSTGMVLRLAFAVAAHVDPEILIVDEALAVGDIAFRQRCMRKIHELRAQGATILFVSHAAADVKALCERCLWLQNGVAQELGETDAVVAKYLSASLHKEIEHDETESAPARSVTSNEPPPALTPPEPGVVPALPQTINGRHRFGDGRATIIGADLVDSHGQPVRDAAARDHVVLRIRFRANAPIASPLAGFLVRNNRGENIFGTNTARENYPLPAMLAGDANSVNFHWSVPPLAPGAYRISLACSDGNVEDFEVCDYIEDAIELTAPNPGPEGASARGYFQLPCAAVTIHRNFRCK